MTVLERSEHIAEWVRITEKKVAQVAPPRGSEQPANQGIRAASREVGIERTEVQRSNKIDTIAPEAKQAARAAGIDANQSALLKVAAASKEEQVAAVRRISAEQFSRRARKILRERGALGLCAAYDADPTLGARRRRA